MTDEQIIELMATKVMGWELPKFIHYESFSGAWVRDKWNPLLKIEHAWMVVEKLAMEGDEHPANLSKGKPCYGDEVHPVEVCKNYAFKEGWTCYLNDYSIMAYAETAQRAICLAALKAHGIEVEP